jgi:hypothetical protein
LCGRLGGGDHEDLGFGEVLAEGKGDVAGARGHVDQQEVGLAPVGIDQELFEGLVQHGPPPDHRGVVGDEEPHRQAADAVGRGGDHQVADDQRLGGDPEHLGDGEPVDVGIEHADVVSHPGQGDRQVDGDRRLADPSLARGDPEDPGLRPREHEAVRAALLVAELSAVGVPVSVAVVRRVLGSSVDRLAAQQHAEARPGLLSHDHPVHRELVDSGQGADGPADPVHQFVDLGVVGHRQGDFDGHLFAPGLHPADHAQLPQRAAQLGIGHGGNSVCDLGLVDWHPGTPRENSASSVD